MNKDIEAKIQESNRRKLNDGISRPENNRSVITIEY
jgi:hypothetical protein